MVSLRKDQASFRMNSNFRGRMDRYPRGALVISATLVLVMVGLEDIMDLLGAGSSHTHRGVSIDQCHDQGG